MCRIWLKGIGNYEAAYDMDRSGKWDSGALRMCSDTAWAAARRRHWFTGSRGAQAAPGLGFAAEAEPIERKPGARPAD